MITRRRGRLQTAPVLVEEEPVEVCSADLCPSGATPQDLDTMELDDLFRVDDFSWTLERDEAPLFDLELSALGIYSDPAAERGGASSASSPDRREEMELDGNRHRKAGVCPNKNAIAARLNRIKKKQYVSGLERKVSAFSSEVNGLKREKRELMKRVEELEEETRYLRAVLANDSALAQLLGRLGGLNGMKLSSSLFQGAAADPSDHDYALPRPRPEEEEESEGGAGGGVCLHVDRNHVSVEFCPKCSERASAVIKM